MGNVSSQSSQISASRFEGLRSGNNYHHRSTKAYPKVLPEPSEARGRLRHTNNGDILQSGGTLSGRHHLPIVPTKPSQRFSVYKDDTIITAQSRLGSQYKSEPDLRLPILGQDMREKRSKKKYKAPAPPHAKREIQSSVNWEEQDASESFAPRRARLYKTRIETKKESTQLVTAASEQPSENNSDVVEEKIFVEQNIVNTTTNYVKQSNRLSLPELNLNESNEFKAELKQATDRFRQVARTALKREEPSGKESSTSERSPILPPPEVPKPKAFYFGMGREEDSEISSTCHIDEDEERSSIALRLRPVLPRKPPQVPHFSPTAAWRLLDARSQDSGISGDARPLLSSSWTPQQDLGDDSSLEEIRRDLIPKSGQSTRRHKPHIFSLSLPRDLQPTGFTSASKTSVSSLRKLKRSVSGVLSTFAMKKDADICSFQEDANWFLSRSAPNSINENSPDSQDISYLSHTSRVMYLPEENNQVHAAEHQQLSSAFSKSCEELKMPESLRDEETSWSKETPAKKQKKFTFQSTVRQIERRRIAERLSKEAERKERQRLQEVEAMARVEEEFQKKRAKEKADIRQQLRTYAMDETKWTSLPFEVNNMKLEERQEPDGALSSSASSPTPIAKQQYNASFSESKRTAPVTQELSEFRQTQRDYKEYRSLDNRAFINKPAIVLHPEVTCNMPNAKGSSFEKQHGNYRKEFAYGMRKTRSIESNRSEDSPQMYRNKFAPITRF